MIMEFQLQCGKKHRSLLLWAILQLCLASRHSLQAGAPPLDRNYTIEPPGNHQSATKYETNNTTNKISNVLKNKLSGFQEKSDQTTAKNSTKQYKSTLHKQSMPPSLTTNQNIGKPRYLAFHFYSAGQSIYSRLLINQHRYHRK